jgi:hypothetical protein
LLFLQSNFHFSPNGFVQFYFGFLLDEPVEQVVEKLKSKGVRFHGPVQKGENFPIRLAFFDDSEGNDLYLCEMGN